MIFKENGGFFIMGTAKKRGNGEGTIFKREIKGKLYGLLNTLLKCMIKNGKEKEKTIYGKTRQEVKIN